MYIE